MTNPGLGPEQPLLPSERLTNPNGEMVALRFDVTSLLESEVGKDWQTELKEAVGAGTFRQREPDGHYTNREQGNTAKLGLVTADGSDLAAKLPGLWQLYQGPFKGLMQQALPEGGEPLKVYDEPKVALEGYQQKPVASAWASDMQHRMEAHVDMRYTAVLVVAAPENEADGGRLVIGDDPNAQSADQIATSPGTTFIKHVPGSLLCFSQGRLYPHYTEEVTNPEAERVVVSLNYPVESEPPEAAAALLKHINGNH